MVSGRQRRAGADHELQPIEAELVEDRHEHAGAAGAIERLLRQARSAVPAPPGIARARNFMASSARRALGAAGVEDAEEHLRGEFLQVARHGDQHGRRTLEQGRRQIFRAFPEMRDEPRDQRQRHRDVAAEHMAERQVADGAMRLLCERRIVIDEVRGRRQMLAVGDQRALRMAGGARRIDDEGGRVGVEQRRLLLEPGEVRLARPARATAS